MRPRVLDLRGVLDSRGVLRSVIEPKCVLKGAVLRHLVVPGLILLLGLGSAFAQSGDNNHAQDQSGKPAAATPSDAVKENQRKVDQFSEAAQAINGPAGNPECVWLGRRVVQLVWVDDLDTAFRHLDLYDRFGCPGGHIQAAFRCLTRFGAQIDDKVPRSLSDHVHGCWINPNAQPQAAAPAAAPAPTTAGSAAPAPAAPQPAPSASPSPQPPAK
jgi:pyruvate/2-oxoglutarate dehydrogenase complex dihydrolipoamide acyltransferase (E2) component